MGFLDEIKKVFFGAKAVTKSAADRAMEKSKEAGQHLRENADELIDEAGDKASEVGRKVLDKADDIWDKAVDKLEDIGDNIEAKHGDKIKGLKDLAEDIGEDVIEKTSAAVNKAKDVAEDIGRKVMDKTEDLTEDARDASENLKARFKGEENVDESFSDSQPSESTADKIMDDAKDIAAGIGAKVLDVKSDLLDKAKEASANISDKLDETLEKAKRMDAEEALKPDYKEQSPLLEKDLLEDKDDFFSKAEAFADGRYDEVRDPFDNKPKIERIEIEEPELVNDEPLAGFEDLDGDGNEIIDDAIILDDEE